MRQLSVLDFLLACLVSPNSARCASDRSAQKAQRPPSQRVKPSKVARPPSVATFKFQAGDYIELFGLKSMKKMNGKRGVILNYSKTKGRYLVDLDESSSRMYVKEDNLRSLILPPA